MKKSLTSLAIFFALWLLGVGFCYSHKETNRYVEEYKAACTNIGKTPLSSNGRDWQCL